MPRSRDFLERFRPAASPGAAGSGGVPADRIAELAAELGPMLALLQDAEDEARRLRQEADAYAASRVAEAAATADAIESDGRRRADAERADAAAEVARRTQEEAAAALTVARMQADEIAATAEARMPDVLARVRAVMRAHLEDLLA